MPNTPYNPSWKPFEKDLSSTDLDKALKASDAFEETRDKELQTSQKARNWEKGRKQEIAKNKSEWVKQKRQEELDPIQKSLMELKQGGFFDSGIQPMPGFVLIKPEFKEKTDSGIYLTNEDSAKMNTNTGVVLAIGKEIVHLAKVVEPPVGVGDRVLMKKGLPGLEMSVKGEYCLLMQWSDLLGRIENA